MKNPFTIFISYACDCDVKKKGRRSIARDEYAATSGMNDA